MKLLFLLVALLIRVAVIGFVLSVGISHIVIGHNIAEDDYDAKAKDKLYYSENSNSQVHPVFTSIIHFLIGRNILYRSDQAASSMSRKQRKVLKRPMQSVSLQVKVLV